MLDILHTLAAVWLGAVALAGVGILVAVGWRLAFPPKRPAIATMWTYTETAGQTDRRVAYMTRRTAVLHALRKGRTSEADRKVITSPG